MKDNGLKVLNYVQDVVNKLGQMVQFMKDGGIKTKPKEKED